MPQLMRTTIVITKRFSQIQMRELGAESNIIRSATISRLRNNVSTSDTEDLECLEPKFPFTLEEVNKKSGYWGT